MKIEKIVSTTIPDSEKKTVAKKIELDNFKSNLDFFSDFNLVEKTKKDLEIIELWEREINFLFKELFLDKKFYISPDEVFFIDDQEVFEGDNYLGFFNSINDGIMVNTSVFGAAKYKSLLHEMIHLASYRAAYIEKEVFELRGGGKGEQYQQIVTRLGYDIDGSKFDWFNEAITEKITHEIFETKINFLIKNKYIHKENINSYLLNSYEYEQKYVDIIIDNVAKKLKIDRGSFWNDIKRGIFSGELMHLRKIEKVYGNNFLKFMSEITFLFEKSDWSEEELLKVFKLTNGEEREKYIKNIFSKKKNSDEKYKDYLIRLKTIYQK